jgi:hypothetical protein
MDSPNDDLCPECGILRDEELIPEAYEAIWDALPQLRAAQDAGITVNCSECGRQLTFEDRGRVGSYWLNVPQLPRAATAVGV